MDTAIQGKNVEVVAPTKLEKILSMKGGSGENSYMKNSQAQARHARSMLHLLEEALDAMELPLPTVDSLPFTVADLGCSCGANTLFIIEVIVNHVSNRYKLMSSDDHPPEFQAFFSDLPSNDFNVLFQLLSTTTTGDYYAAGVPGSFYHRLFPARSINVFHSAFSLHWLSQVPEAVADRRSKAYNAGRVFVHGSSEWTTAAYQHQFKSDLARFLNCRAEEMRRGGVMFVACLGRTATDPADQGGASLMFGTHFQDAWNDLVQEGLVEAEKRDDFNVPIYAPRLEEFKDVVETNGSFGINRLEVVNGGSPLVLSHPDDAVGVGQALVNSCRSVCGVLVEAHIGERLSDELFARLERRATAHVTELVEHLQFLHIVASLRFQPTIF